MHPPLAPPYPTSPAPVRDRTHGVPPPISAQLVCENQLVLSASDASVDPVEPSFDRVLWVADCVLGQACEIGGE